MEHTEHRTIGSDTQWRMDAPAREWTQALPLGNGRLGAMLWGGVRTERIGLNHDTFWSGYPGSIHDNPHYRDLPTPDPDAWTAAGDAALAGDWARTEEILLAHFTGPYTEAYLPLGDLELQVTHPTDAEATGYRRVLDYETAVLTQQYMIDGVGYTREAWVSAPDGVLVVRFRTEAPEGVGLRVRITSQVRDQVPAARDRAAWAEAMDGPYALRYLQAPAHVMPPYLHQLEDFVQYGATPEAGGMAAAIGAALVDVTGRRTAVADGAEIVLEGATDALLIVAAGTGFAGPTAHPWTEGVPVVAPLVGCLDRAVDRAATDPEGLRAAHEADMVPKVRRVRWGGGDLGQIRPLFHFSRYLLLAASRPGTEPTNLQGLWNAEMTAPWSANYTININTQMNYWGAEPLNLSECHRPLLEKLPGLAEAGRGTAARYYGAPGTVAHHNTDLWNHTAPVGALEARSLMYACWPLGLAWLTQHLFDHYAYTKDRKFLRTTALPVLTAQSRFFLALLRPDAEGQWVLAPSTSPEHGFRAPDGQVYFADVSTEMTQALVHEVLTHTGVALDLAGAGAERVDPTLRAQIRTALGRLRGPGVNTDGTLMEWHHEAPDMDPRHRHISHLYGLYPGTQIHRHRTPALADAARRTLEVRGPDGTGWSLGWKILFHARLGDPAACRQLLAHQLRDVAALPSGGFSGGSYPNLFSAHPPFQIDGNFASGAAIAAMLLDSEWLADDGGRMTVAVDVLPALPPEWGYGWMTGLRLRGGIEADVRYRDGALEALVLRPLTAEPTALWLTYGDRVVRRVLGDGALTLGPEAWDGAPAAAEAWTAWGGAAAGADAAGAAGAETEAR